MKVIIDADSLIYAAAFQETIGLAMESFNHNLSSILSDLSDFLEVDDVVLCNGSRNNFRKVINASYKLNRTQEPPKLLSELHNQVKLAYDSKWADGFETDDVVASLWKQEVDKNGDDSVVIVSLDKDYKQLPCWFYDYYWSRKDLDKISHFESKYNFYAQMVVGDAADNVNYCKGYGRSWVRRNFENINTVFGLIKKVMHLYQEIYGVDWREKYIECYTLLKLRTDVYE